MNTATQLKEGMRLYSPDLDCYHIIKTVTDKKSFLHTGNPKFRVDYKQKQNKGFHNIIKDCKWMG